MFFSKHLPPIGQGESWEQLQSLFWVSSVERTFELAPAMILFIFGVVLYEILIVCLFAIFRRGCPRGKHWSTSFKNSFPTFVLTFRL